METTEGKDKLVLGLALAGLFISAGLIFNDNWLARLVIRGQLATTKRIGSVARLQSDVRRRTAQELTWLPLRSSSAVFEGDSIFTGQDSEAEIALQGGDKLVVKSNSLVVLSKKSGETNLDVQYGSITGQITGGENVKIRLGGKDTTIRGKNARVQIRASEAETRISVVEGELEVKADGKTNVLKKADALQVLDEGKKVELTRNHVSLLEPVAESVLWRRPTDSVRFAWRAPSEEKRFELELSKSPTFGEIWRTVEVVGRATELSSLPNQTRLFWRVRSLDNRGAASNSSEFIYHEIVTPTPIEPSSWQKLLLSWAENGGTVDRPVALRWEDRSDSGTYRVQLKDQQTGRVLVDETSIDKHFVTRPLAKGDYGFRVQALHGAAEASEWSAWSDFSLVEAPPVRAKPLSPPRLAEEVPQHFELRSTADPNVLAKLEPRSQQQLLRRTLSEWPNLRWQGVSEAQGYQLEVAREADEDFSRPILLKSLESTQFVWRQAPLGRYRWRLRSVNDDLEPGAPSPSKILVVMAKPPDPLGETKIIDRVPSAAGLSRPLREVSLRWSPTPFAELYEVQLATEPSFSKVKSLQAEDTSLAAQPLQLGANYWRVRGLRKSGEPVSDFSPPRQIDYRRLVELAPPSSLSPLPQSSIVLVGLGAPSILFEWANVEGAQQFVFEFAQNSDFSDLVLTRKTRAPRTLVDTDLAPGQYYWRVKAVRGESSSPWTEENSFILRRQKSPSK